MAAGPTKGEDVWISRDEVHFAFVRPLGTDLDSLIQHLSAVLVSYGFAVEKVKLSEIIVELTPKMLPLTAGQNRYEAFMDAGDALRENQGHAVLALNAMLEVRTKRGLISRDRKRVAFIYDSLMHPAETQALREVYGSSLVVIALHANEDLRVSRIKQKLMAGGIEDSEEAEKTAKQLVTRDRRRQKPAKSQMSFEDTFKDADVFLDGAMHRQIVGSESSDPILKRVLRQLFSFPFGTPTLEETAMGFAYHASLRSGALSRRVGAALVRSGGEVIATGCNDVPKAGGGLYGSDDGDSDRRDFLFKYYQHSFRTLSKDTQGADSNDLVKLEMLAGLLEALESDLELEQALPRAKRSPFFDVIAYGRTVHAEMDCLTAAARLGLVTKDCVLYSTTFPCHECARHIVAAGVKTVVYIEPYPKSRVSQLHPDSILILDGAEQVATEDRVVFRPFFGISPSIHTEIYSFIDRKYDNPGDLGTYGTAVAWEPSPNQPLREAMFGSAELRDLRAAAVAAAEEGIKNASDKQAT
jgi:deoxycytidylate deaminase